MKTQKTFVIPDLQIPYHSPGFVDKLFKVIDVCKPDVICIIGDFMDFPEVSRWTKGGRGEFEPTLQGSLDKGRKILETLRAVAPKATIHYKMGNHDERLEKYIGDYAPAVLKLRSNDIGYQLGLAGVDVQLQRDPFVLAPGVLAIHGHERAYSSVSGRYEMARIQQYGMSVVSGHTHTPVLVTVAQGHGSRQKHFWGMNVGHGMDVKKVGYTKDGHVNWCQGFGIIETDSRGVSHPRLITAPGGRFTFGGVEY